MEETTKIAIFKGRKVRRMIHQNEWYFSIVDVVGALTDSNKPRVYWNAMKIRVKASDGIELSTICRQLKLEAPDGKKYETDCANTEGIAGGARRKLEKRLGRTIVSKNNFLPTGQREKIS